MEQSHILGYQQVQKGKEKEENNKEDEYGKEATEISGYARVDRFGHDHVKSITTNIWPYVGDNGEILRARVVRGWIWQD